MKGTIFYFVITLGLLGIGSFNLSNKLSITPVVVCHQIPTGELAENLIGKWDYIVIHKYFDKEELLYSLQFFTGEVEYKKEGSYINEIIYKRYGRKNGVTDLNIEYLQGTSSGIIEGCWGVSKNQDYWMEMSKKCSSSTAENGEIPCGYYKRVLYGNYYDDGAKFSTKEFSNNKIELEGIGAKEGRTYYTYSAIFTKVD